MWILLQASLGKINSLINADQSLLFYVRCFILEVSHKMILYSTRLIGSITLCNLIGFRPLACKSYGLFQISLGVNLSFRPLSQKPWNLAQSLLFFPLCSIVLCCEITSSSLAFYFSSQLYPHSHTLLTSGNETHISWTEKRKKINKKNSKRTRSGVITRKFLTPRITPKLMLNV